MVTIVEKTRTIDALAEEFAAIEALLAELDDSDWSAPSPCPGWDVGANVAHMIGTESHLAGMDAPPDIRVLFADVPADDPFVWTEQLMPAVPLVRVGDVDQAIALAKKAEGNRRHTATMHSRNVEKLSQMAHDMNCSIFVKNGPGYAGIGGGGEGHTSFTIAGPTGEGLTSVRSFVRRRRCVLVDYFRIV